MPALNTPSAAFNFGCYATSVQLADDASWRFDYTSTKQVEFGATVHPAFNNRELADHGMDLADAIPGSQKIRHHFLDRNDQAVIISVVLADGGNSALPMTKRPS